MSHAEELRSALGKFPAGFARGLGRARLTPRVELRAGRLRAGLFYATMPALSGVNAVVGLLLPLLLDPEQFGRYAVIVTLFQYGLIFDFGLSQLTDRRVPALIARELAGREPTVSETPTQAGGERVGFVNAVLWTRLYIALAVLLSSGAVIAALRMAGCLPYSPADCMLSLTAGLCFMVTLGPASVYRAASQRGAFGRISIALMLILAVARPAGLLVGGITGSFLALAAAYAALACLVQAGMPLRARARPGTAVALSLMAQGLPLFMTSFVWAFYMTANRWVVSTMADGVETGHFAFASNIVTLIVGAIGALAQFYYPRIVTQATAGGAFSVSRRLGREFCLLVAAVSVPTAIGVIIGPSLVHLLYPKFVPSIPIVLLLLLAVPSLTVASWLMPVALSTASRPWIEGLVVYPAALAVLIVATRAGLAAAGTTGAAWGLVASAGPLLVLQLATLHHAGLLRWGDALRIGGASALATGLLAALEFA